jgi:hypothetical protein
LIRLLIQKLKENRLNPKKVLGHREFPEVKKTCPGKNIDLNLIREILGKEMQI